MGRVITLKMMAEASQRPTQCSSRMPQEQRLSHPTRYAVGFEIREERKGDGDYRYERTTSEYLLDGVKGETEE
jgi:hypothetical protein